MGCEERFRLLIKINRDPLILLNRNESSKLYAIVLKNFIDLDNIIKK